MNSIKILGLFAGTLTTISFFASSDQNLENPVGERFVLGYVFSFFA